MATMKALVYKSLGKVVLEERPRPTLVSPTDAIVKVTKTTICGSDLHILAGHVPTVRQDTVLGHEGVGIVEQVGDSVRSFKKGSHVLISCISSCAICEYCRRGMLSHCNNGGWILGHTVDGTQAEYVRVAHADSSLHPIPNGADEGAIVMLSDIFPTGLECGVLNGKVHPGGTVCIVGAGPVGLAAFITSQLYSPSLIFVVDKDAHRREVAKSYGAHHTVDPENIIATVRSMTQDKGCDTVIEAVGIPATFDLCQDLVAPGGTIANVGVHGKKVDLHLEKLWSLNISIATQLVDTVTIPMLLKLVLSGKIDASKLISHRFNFKDMEEAYSTFGMAADHKALKVLISM